MFGRGKATSVEDDSFEDRKTAVLSGVGAQGQDDFDAMFAFETLRKEKEARRRRGLLIGLVFALVTLVLAILFLVGQYRELDSAGAFDARSDTGTVYFGDFIATISASGTTVPVSSTVVSPEVDGIVEEVEVEEGQRVNAGDVLFTIKSESATKVLEEAQAAFDKASEDVAKADAAVNEAYDSYQEKWKECRESGDWSNFDEDELKGKISEAEDAYKEAKERQDSTRNELSEAREADEKRAVRAPVAGTLVVLRARNGIMVSGGVGPDGTLAEIADLHQMKVTVQVNEVDISRVKPEMWGLATFSALPGVESAAEVVRVASQATDSDAGGFGGVVTDAVDLVIASPDEQLKPGMTASVTIVSQYVPDALVVPSQAVWKDRNGSDYVTVLVDGGDGRTRDVLVTVVDSNDSEAAVEGDLRQGDVVLLVGAEGDASGRAEAAD